MTNSRNRTLEDIRSQVEAWGLEPPLVDRIFTSEAHTGRFNVGRYTMHMEDMMHVHNSLGLCSIYSYQGLIFGHEMARLYQGATGEPVTAGDLVQRGERISNLCKLVNVREGFGRQDDRVPVLWFRPMDSPEGRIEMRDYFNTKPITREDADRMLTDYYNERGWDPGSGTPTPEKIKELGLERFALRPHTQASS